MSEFVKKTNLGYKAVTGGYSDPELTHVILTKSEYDGMKKETEAAKQRASSAELSKKLGVEAAYRQAAEEISKIRKQDAMLIEQERDAYNQAQAECDYQTRLNKNLLRIAKERANADRKLKPKREHTGYVVISSTEKDHSYKYGANRKTVRLWETVLQTPFSIDFTEEQARTETEELFWDDESDGWPVEKIGITGMYLDGYGEMIRDKNATEWLHRNVVVERKLRANFRAGYWEIVFLHTKPLGIVPAEMRP